MGGSKRPLPEEFKVDGSTDALCRAVKRLHTHSQDVSSRNTASKEVDLGGGEEASSTLQEAAQRDVQNQPHPGNVGSDVRSGGGDGEPAVERAGGGTGAMRGGGDVHRLGKPQCSLPAGLDNLNFDDRDEGGLEPDDALQMEEGVRQVLAGIHVDRDSQGEESVPQPGTPSREEAASPSAKQGHRLGTCEGGGSREYEELYEEANNLLKNLHFEWLHRKSQN